ncbi:efflux transporter outer membrane subunit [Limnobacter humi]|uniref:Efflux transporter outer membrane subunit n=1 Tax=Limnobacter humi TaxID=1778671 RepID=A0ABT1WDB1_9BURK|nr:efflux transporter outer membrane subunit [Limnobacter humi]MCQ8895510.1 efflux transporter outer membrane subunit [Limnobacter humi]
MKLTTLPKTMVALGVATLLSACASNIPLLNTFKPQAQPEKVVVQQPEGTTGVGMNGVDQERWWLLLNDPVLTQVVEQALKNNTDVRLANERLNEAGAVLGLAKSAKYPAIFGQITENRARTSRSTNSPFVNNNLTESTRLGIGATWELDLWGKISAQEDAARASFMQQGYNMRGVRLSVAATAASLYTQIRVLDLQVKVLEQTLQSREAAYKLAQQRYDVGLSNELQLRQTEAEYQSVRAQLPDTREQLSRAMNALAVIVAGNPPALQPLKVENLQLTKLFILPENTPSELLLRRPDLSAAEQQLAAADANLNVARKAFFPSIGLSAFAGRESFALENLFTGPAKVWNFQAQITQPIFQAGALFDARDAAVARRNQAVLQYEASIRTAFQEVYDAIVAQREARERLTARQKQVETLTEVVRLAQLRVDNGVANQLELLDAQRNLLAAQLSWASAWQQQQGATLLMVRALGGGFKREAEQTASN